tara:strand:+ start:1187 stop:2923 length:1737 start_codon:yes stop_codon:yes gene_type:complete
MAITNASRLADFSTGIGTAGAVIQVDNDNNRLGVGTDNPQSTLQVGIGITMDGNAGIITANKFVGDGSGLVNAGVTTDLINSTQIKNIGVVTTGTAIVGSAVTINSTGIDAVSGVVTAANFVGGGANLTNLNGSNISSGTVAAARVATLNQNTTGTSGGLTGTPDITIRNVTGVAATFTGVLTYEDVTNVDSVGIITARSGVNVTAGNVFIGQGGSGANNAELKLQSGSGTGNDIVAFLNQAGTTKGNLTYDTDNNFLIFNVNESERVRIDSSGNLGVGENAADVRLHVKETIDVGYTTSNAATDANNLLKLENPSTTANAFSGMQFRTGSGADMFVGLIQQSVNAGDLYVTNQNSPDKEILRIKSTGSVGIGLTNPTRLLQVSGSGANCRVQISNTNGGTGSLYVDDSDNVHVVSGANPGNLILDTVGTERVSIDSNGGVSFNNAQLVERVKITAGKLSDNTNIDLENGMVHYFTTQETTTSTPNIRVNSSTTLNSVMDAGDVITVTLITTAAAGGYSANLTIDGNAVTEEWIGGSAPSAGGSDGLDIYAYTIICTHATNTGDSGFKVIGNLTNATN